MTKTALFLALSALTACVGATPETPEIAEPSKDEAPAPAPSTTTAPGPAETSPALAPPAVTATPKGCDLDAPFQKPTRIEALRSQYYDLFPRLSADELTIYFAREDAYGGPVPRRIFFAKRASIGDAWNTPEVVAYVNDGTDADTDPSLSPDELSLTFASSRPGTGSQDLWMVTRPNKGSNFGNPVQIGGLNSTAVDRSPVVVRDGAEIWFTSNRTGGLGGTDIYRAARNAAGNGYETPVLVSELSSSSNENALAVSNDGLTVYFSSLRAGGSGADDIWVAKRASVNDAFGAPVNVAELNTDAWQAPGFVSNDGCRLYYESSDYQQADYDLWVAEKPAKQ